MFGDGTWVIAATLALVTLLVPAVWMVRRYAPGDRKFDHSNEDRDAQGAVVEVLETVFDSNDQGRIRFQGSTWPATTIDGEIAAGGKARLVYRNKLAWIVEPVDASTDLTRFEAELAERKKG